MDDIGSALEVSDGPSELMDRNDEMVDAVLGSIIDVKDSEDDIEVSTPDFGSKVDPGPSLVKVEEPISRVKLGR